MDEDEDEEGGGTGKEGEGDEVNTSDDDFQNSPVNKPGTRAKRRLKADAVVTNASVVDGKKAKKTPVDQRKSAASNTRAARKGSKS